MSRTCLAIGEIDPKEFEEHGDSEWLVITSRRSQVESPQGSRCQWVVYLPPERYASQLKLLLGYMGTRIEFETVLVRLSRLDRFDRSLLKLVKHRHHVFETSQSSPSTAVVAEDKPRTILWLSIASTTDETDPRLEKRVGRRRQIVEGLTKLFEHSFPPWVDICLFDNTTRQPPKEIRESLPDRAVVRAHENNRYGRLNKGAGLLDEWRYYRELIGRYELLVHFEPRQLLIDHDFFRRIEGSRFRVLDDQFYTGLFAIRTSDLLEFADRYTPQWMVERRVNIETLLYGFMSDRSYQKVDRLNLIWHDSYAGVDRIY
jgi:hypothetical protein